ncbi:hypothetical protein CANARDRAFT_6724 [[Candida] arabinofermentans NRRL YB-2248]|uniref:NADP-dependent oxidoreductase domain-containing protein n=1 Tax=[Candida] arabinofermentans NRRL YB-2248 TaxID=983967 RepID=A0A1E4T393_9ASCO|nr:hypothetical protein CANARDRAFT_6724 [[Candida] arabinofermentans NRRL YB-2248]
MNWEKVPKSLYTNLGSSGLKISRIIVGCMSFGKTQWADWVVEDEEKVFAIMKAAYDAGIRTFDTADMYSNGYSEVLLGKFLKKYNIKRSTVVIMTKCFVPVEEDDYDFTMLTMTDYPGHEYVNRSGLSRKHILDAVDKSVENLGTYIDLYQIHRFDKTTPIEETMSALNATIQSGKVRYIGASTMRTYQFVMMQNCAEKYGYAKFISMQAYYSLLYREEEEEMIAYCNATGVGLIPWSPNAGGALTRPFKDLKTTDRGKSTLGFLGLAELGEHEKEIVNRVEELSKKYGVSMASISVAWVISKGNSPIIGFTKPERINDALDGVNVKLSQEDIGYLEEPYLPKPLPQLYTLSDWMCSVE